MRFDDILNHVGGFGRYQKQQLLLTGLPPIMIALHQLASVFLAATPEFRCSNPAFNGRDKFSTDVSKLSHNTTQYTPFVTTAAEPKIDMCHVYSTPHSANSSMVKCLDFVYSMEYYDRTIVTQWNLVCDSKAKSTLSTSLYMVGRLLGAITFGILSDMIGRKKTMLLCTFLLGAVGIATAFSPNYITFVILRLIIGAVATGLYMTLFIIGVELLGKKYRMFAGIMNEFNFGIGHLLLTGIAYVSRNWVYTQIAISAPVFLFLSYYWLVPESARWLLSKTRVKEAQTIIQKAADTNGIKLPDDLNLEDEKVLTGSLRALLQAKALLLRTLIVFLNWFSVASSYYAVTLASGNMGANVYLTFALSGAIGFASVMAALSINRLGRKGPYIFGLFVGGLASISTVLVDHYGEDLGKQTRNNFFIAFNILGKFGLTMGFTILYIWSAEIYPTVMRNSLMGLSSTIARVGTMIAPFIADIGNFVPVEYVKILQSGVLGSLLITSALLALMLPETLGVEIPETVEQANAITRKSNADKGNSTRTNKMELNELEKE